MGKVIKIRDAQIRTVSIEIKSMTIDDRQVTLALFRQLIEEDLISRAGTLNGLPWGFVNYHPGKCADSKLEHWHIVWQKGDELRRATELQEPRFGPLCSDLIDQWANVSVCVAFEAAPGVRLNEHVEADGPTVFAHACRPGVRGGAARGGRGLEPMTEGKNRIMLYGAGADRPGRL